jgi:FkbM family methyltransferase
MLMRVKKFLRSRGYDLIRYHSFYDSVLKPMGIATILDIGANVGEFSKDMRTLFPSAQIYAFEPLADCFAVIGQKMQGDEKFQALNVALGEVAGDTVINRSSFHPSSSLLPMAQLHKDAYPKSKDSIEEKIQIMRLDDALAGKALATPLFIKMDVQGYEDKVINGGPHTLAQASVLQIETSFVQLYEGQPLFNDICQLVQGLGFSYAGETAQHYDKQDHLIYQDSIFVRLPVL